MKNFEISKIWQKAVIFVAGFTMLFVHNLHGQVISTIPALPTDGDAVTVTFRATGTPLQGFTGDVYAHTGVILAGNPSWQNVIGSWGNNATQPPLTRIEPDVYQLVITPNIRQFYNVAAGAVISRMAFVFRAAAGAPQTIDLFVDVFASGLNASVISPTARQPIIEFGEIVNVSAVAREAIQFQLFINDQLVQTATGGTIDFAFNSTIYGQGSHWIIARATNSQATVYDSVYVFVRSQPTVAALPTGVVLGINYIDDHTVTLVLHDPPGTKDFAFVIGDFNNWSINEQGYMNVTPCDRFYWITLTGLERGREYGFQYVVDGYIRIADPYTEKVLDPWHDNEIISEGRYPGLIPFPQGKTEHHVSVFQTARVPFTFTHPDFMPPPVEELVIYEVLIRDFLHNNTYQQLRDSLNYLKRLGINAIHIMPIMEFEGNLSWGYNTTFFFAPDKYYGPRQELKKLIDEAQKMGIAVILDIVFNHTWGPAPHLRMYWDQANNRPAPDNPWYSEPIYANPAMNFGFKLDHGSPYFIEFMDRVVRHWLEVYNVDGFRLDLTKGFTTRFKGQDDWWGSNTDQERIENLRRLYRHIKQVNPNALVIIEHLAGNEEETILANYGMLLWGNVSHAFQEAAMGWLPQSDFSWASWRNRNWNNPHLITYLESHDEERIMYKNLTFGNSTNPAHDVKELPVALQRAGQVAVFSFAIPGPKLIWQFAELGYDYSINHCQDGTISPGCRTNPKPVRWDYYVVPERKRLFHIYSLMINLRQDHEVFSTRDFTHSLAGAGKRIHLNHATNNVTVLGNFGVTPVSIVPNFQQTGIWYEYFTCRSINVADVREAITLEPGEFRLYSTVEFPDHGKRELFGGTLVDAEEGKVVFYPNPTTGRVVFQLNADHNHHLRIYDRKGGLVYHRESILGQDVNTFNWDGRASDGSHLSAGVYFFHVYSDSNSERGKIIILGER